MTLSPPPAPNDQERRIAIAADAIRSLQHALRCIDAIGASEAGARLDHALQSFRNWCARQEGLEALAIPHEGDSD